MDTSNLSPELLAIHNDIVAKGDEIRALKGSGTAKDALMPHITSLNELKDKFKAANGGVAYGPPPAPKKEKVKGPAQEASKKDGPSKKELNKLAKKAKKQGAAASSSSDTPPVPPAGGDSKAVRQTSAPTDSSAALSSSLSALSLTDGVTLFHHPSRPPALARLALLLTDSPIAMTATAASAATHHPYLFGANCGSISGDYGIARYLLRQHPKHCALLAAQDPWKASQVDQWLDHCLMASSSADPVAAALGLVAILETHLQDKTFAVGSGLTLADLALHQMIGNKTSLGPAVARWHALITQLVPKMGPVGGKADGNAKKGKGKSKSKVENDDDGTSCPPLEDAEMGKVVTRFPPEPSGYLHIGHSKAALLNQYYAERYKGKLIVRFDDTNPTKEKGEYADNIIRDLATLNIKGDKITHTSDSFDICQKYARQMIKEGKAFMDDTDQEKMQAERMARTNSYRRDTSVEENLALFEGLLAGAPECQKFCLRAKIDMKSVNGTMRDPVLYRYNAIPHHRTGTKYKAYPTYDFACPIVDSIEGVTHALRTTEYNDRDEQFQWIAKALGLRHVHIMTYGKINFIYTVLSKRKLTWYVEQKLVDGWNDARFPTIQGCIRRGMNVESLKKFIISQGASRRVINMEWDKFWSENKKMLEASAPRYMANSAERKVLMTVTNVSPDIVVDSVQIHPQKPEMGMRALRKSNSIYLELDDCNTFKEGEEVTLMRWGNFFMDKITKNAAGDVTIEARFHPEATNFSKTKKITWIAAIPDLVPCQLVEFDHLISKPVIKDGEDFKDFVTPVSRAETAALGDPYLRTTQKGEVIQLERKGFYRCDRPYGGSPDKPAVLFLIPDGRTKAMSTLTSALSHR